MILKESVNFGGRIYPAGESAKGRFPLDFITLLKQNGVIDDIDSETLDGLPQGDPQDESGGTGEEEIIAPSVDEFTNLTATQQKQILTSIGYEPGSNKEERITQYIEWYDDDSDGDPSASKDPDSEDGNNPSSSEDLDGDDEL